MTDMLKLENLYKYFFYVFIFSIPLQTRKVFLTDYSFYTGAFTESGTIFFYLTDLLFASALLSYVVWNRAGFKRSLSELKAKDKVKERRILGLILFLSVWCFLSAIMSQVYFSIELFRSIKMVEMAALTFFVYIICKDKRFLLSSLFMVIISAIFQSIIAILQFIFQHSVFTSTISHKVTGETILSPDLPGIAKITADGENIIRAYGTFPHPNILGGFLIVAITLSLYIYLCHRHEYLSSLYDFLNLRTESSRKRMTSTFWSVAFFVQFTALLFTFSRSAWMGTAVTLICFFLIYHKHLRIVSRETIQLFVRYKELCFAVCAVIAVVSLNYGLFFHRATEDTAYPQDINTIILPQNNTFNDRMFFNNVSRETILDKPLWGSGAGTSLFQIHKYLQRHDNTKKMAAWQYQPTHNIYFLIASEIGLIGFIAFCFIIIETMKLAFMKIVSRETIQTHGILLSLILSSFIGLLFVGLFDHYLVTQQQGQLLFWFLIGILLI